MMTRNDFELLANALKSERADIERTYPPSAKRAARLQGFSYAVNCVAGVCKASNARFDTAKFKRACGVSQDINPIDKRELDDLLATDEEPGITDAFNVAP